MNRFIHLRGWRCGDGRRLRFWYREEEFPSSAIGKLEGFGDLVASFPPSRRPGERGGYFLFTSAGQWRVEVQLGDRLLGSVVLQVRPDECC